jgi:hypothetical protein
MKLPEESKVESCWATADKVFEYTQTNILEDEPHNYNSGAVEENRKWCNEAVDCSQNRFDQQNS